MQPCHVCGNATPAAGSPRSGAPRRTRSPYLIPWLVLASVTVLVLAGIVGGVLIRSDDQPVAAAGSAARQPEQAATAAPSPAIDACVLGSWTVTRAVKKETVDGDVLEVPSEGGSTWRFNPDGTGEHDFSNGLTYVVDHEGERVTFTHTGRVTFNYTTEPGRQVRMVNLNSGTTGGIQVSVGGKTVGFEISTDPYSIGFRCDGDSPLELHNEVTSFYLRRA